MTGNQVSDFFIFIHNPKCNQPSCPSSILVRSIYIIRLVSNNET